MTLFFSFASLSMSSYLPTCQQSPPPVLLLPASAPVIIDCFQRSDAAVALNGGALRKGFGRRRTRRSVKGSDRIVDRSETGKSKTLPSTFFG